MKRIATFALVLVLIGSLLAFTSCEATPDAVIAEADQALLSAPYTMTMSMDFDCDNAELSAVFDAMSMEIPITMDGDKLAMNMDMDYMGMQMAINMTVVEKVLYYDMSVAGQSTKMKCTLDDEQFQEFLGANNAQMPVSPSEFGEMTMEEKDGKQIITCTGLSEAGRKQMNDLMGESLGEAGGEMSIGDLSYIVTVKDGKYDSMALTCSYVMSIEGQSFTVTMSMNATYKYEGVAAISAPADADQYQNVNYSDLMG